MRHSDSTIAERVQIKQNMKMARKRKLSPSGERLTRFKAQRKEAISRFQPSHSAPLIVENRKMSTPVKRSVQGVEPDTPSPRRYSPRFKNLKDPPSKEHSSSGQTQPVEPQLPCTQRPLLEEEDTELGLVITLDEEQFVGRRGGRRKGREKLKQCLSDDDVIDDEAEEQESSDEGHKEVDVEEQAEEELCRQLDRALERKSRRHNLTNANVRSILHEVITNEQVVAMMKAAIRETQDMPMFEPKMTRSRLKQVVEKGEAIPSWNISPIKKASELKPPQFVDIPLEEEDSSDEEYCPDDDEEDETAEDTFLESDVESTASSPRVSRLGRPRTPMDSSECDEDRSSSPRQASRQSRHLRVEVVPMGPPPPPQPAGPPRPPRAPPDSSFMEKLHAVEEELDSSPISLEPYQMSGGGGAGGEDSLMACRTRSKRPLRDVPLGRLEAELRAPDITPDMYDCSSALEDREWTQWLQSLMTSDGENEEEGDDEDDPEYNFLDDIDEPDLEDYRNDRAVRITKKEVNELMEELFETFQDELGVQEQDEDGQEEMERGEKVSPQGAAKFNIPQAIRFEEPLVNMLTECHRTVKEQLEAVQQRRALTESQSRAAQSDPGPQVLVVPRPCTLVLSPAQKLQLQQQVQQHIQLLTLVHMLSSPVEVLKSEASTTLHFLLELQSFAQRGEQARSTVEPGFTSIFRACNLQGSLSLLEELKQSPSPVTPIKSSRALCVRPYPLLPSKLAWLVATRSVFLYPELLPQCSLDPALHPRRTKSGYTKGEDCLILLGLKHFGQTEFPYKLMCRYLVRSRTHEQVRTRVHDMCHHRSPDNMFKQFFQRKLIPQVPLICGSVMPGEKRPPVEREEDILPVWLRKSLPYIHRAVMQYNQGQGQASSEATSSNPPYIFPPGTRYPPTLPRNVTLRLHPAKFRATPPKSAPKIRPLRGYRTPTFPSLAKAPGNIPTQGVFLLPKAPYTPTETALPLAVSPLTPADRAVPLAAAYSMPMNPLSQGLGQDIGCAVLPSHDAPPSLPPAILQVPSATPLTTPLFSPGGVTACIMQKPQVQAEVPNQRLRPRKLLPIQPAPLKPPELFQRYSLPVGGGFSVLHLGGGAGAGMGGTAGGTVSSAGVKDLDRKGAAWISNRNPSTRNLTSPAGTSVTCPSTVSEGRTKPTAGPTPPPQDLITHPNGALTRLRKTVRPLLPAPPRSEPLQTFTPTPSDGAVRLKSNPVFVSHTQSPPLKAASENGRSPDAPTGTEGKAGIIEYLSIHYAMNSVDSANDLQSQETAQFPCETLLDSNADGVPDTPCSNFTEMVTLPLTVDQNSLITSNETEVTLTPTMAQDPAGGPQYILVQTTGPGTPQFLYVPQNCLVTPVATPLDATSAAGSTLSLTLVEAPLASGTQGVEELPNTFLSTDLEGQEPLRPQMASEDCSDTQPSPGPQSPSSARAEPAGEGMKDNLGKLLECRAGEGMKDNLGKLLECRAGEGMKDNLVTLLECRAGEEMKDNLGKLLECRAGEGMKDNLGKLLECIEGLKEDANDGHSKEQGEEESGEFGGALLTLSVSSGSPASSLDGCADSLERRLCTEMEREEESTPGSNGELEGGDGEGEGDGDATEGRIRVDDGSGEGHVTCVRLSLTKPAWGAVVLSSGSEGQELSGGGGEKDSGEQRERGGGGGQDGGGEGEQNGKEVDGGEKGEDGEGERGGEGARNGKRGGEGDKDGDGERERQGGDEEEEEDFDDLTQDEDEEEVMSSASEESVLSVPELQETMEKLTWLASERRLCAEGDSEEDNSPNSPNSPTSPVSQNSQEDNSEEEEEGPPKGEESESGEGVARKLPRREAPQGPGTHQASGKGAGRGRGRGRPPPRSLKRSRRQERDSKDMSKLPLLYDNRILDNDPLRESKDLAFAQAYLNRVREALQDVPGKVEEFLGLLYEFEQGGERRSAVELFSQLRPVLKDCPDLLRDFAAFLLPEQALECGLFAEQQAFERSRRFLRQLEISFGENPSHYQKIVRALQGGPNLSDAGIEELKAQMATLLKGHTHLQGEFWVFFDELRPQPSQPGQFEEAVWPEEGGGVTDCGDGGGVGPGGGASGGFEEVTLPDLEEEEEVHKIPPMTARSRRRKELGTHSNDKDCDWSEKDCSCPCHDAAHDVKLRRHKRKGCCHCHTNKVSDSSRGVKRRDAASSLQPESQTERRAGEREEEKEGEKETEAEVEMEVKEEGGSEANSPPPAEGGPLQCDSSEGGPAPRPEDRGGEEEGEEEEEWKGSEREGSPPSAKRSRKEGEGVVVCNRPLAPSSGERETLTSSQPPRHSPCADPPVCAKNISLTPSGEKVILWTREADRVILTACQQQGANQSTFQAISAQLGNKTASEVSQRFRDLMHLFHTAARQASSEDEASNTEQLSATDEEPD